MKNITLSSKVGPSGCFWRALLPFLVLLVGLGASQSVSAQRFNSDNITIVATTTAATSTTTYNGKTPTPATATPLFTGADLGNGGQFDQTNGSLSISTIAANAAAGGTDPGVTGVMLFYRVYASDAVVTSSNPSFKQVNLSTSADPTRNSIPYAYSGASIDLLNQSTVLGGGTYYVEIYYQLSYDDSNTPAPDGAGIGVITDPGNNSNGGYKATFTVKPPAVTPTGGTTNWISNASDAAGTDWLNSKNWSNGVPTRLSNAVIPDKTSDTSTPLLADPNATYEVKTLTLSGSTNSSRALIRIGQSVTGGSPTGATLRIYGDLNCYAGGILAAVSGTNGVANPLTNSTLVLARNDGGAQAVRGSKLSIVDIRVEGRGIKAIVATELSAPNTLTIAPDANGPGAILRTAVDNAPRNANNVPTDNAPDTAFPLNTTQSASVNLKDSGTIFGEKVGSYVQGILIADRQLFAGRKQTFGNIGIDITPSRDISSPNVIVTRTTGDPLRGPVSSNGPATTGNPQPVKRQFGISGDVNNNTTSTITFHYLNSTDELNGNPEENLTLFKTGNNAPPFTPIGRTSTTLGTATTDGTVTKENYSSSLNTVTLGDILNPLPVVLATFTAVRNNTNALLSWTTSSEVNNKGFTVQVSADGVIYRALGFIASQSSNSQRSLNYRYIDTESGKTGTRYYRLLQTDLDGKESYSPVRAIGFDGAIASTSALVAYPNPFIDKLELNFDGSGVADGLAQVKLIDMAGRTVREQNVPVVGASMTFADLTDLRSGLYLAKVMLPDGSTKTVRIQKQ